ncbi:trypsin [Candidatus Peregrinibacteria bacterium]|nr:trypsin [Candidatus Peregrinibacteria bacterium]
MNKKLLGLLTLAFFSTAIFGILVANHGLINKFFPLIVRIPFYDKIGHLFLMGISAFLVNYWLGAKKVKISSQKFLLGSLIVFSIVTIEEFSQIFLQFRTFSLSDMFFDYTGIFFFGKLADICVKINRQKESITENCEN